MLMKVPLTPNRNPLLLRVDTHEREDRSTMAGNWTERRGEALVCFHAYVHEDGVFTESPKPVGHVKLVMN